MYNDGIIYALVLFSILLFRKFSFFKLEHNVLNIPAIYFNNPHFASCFMIRSVVLHLLALSAGYMWFPQP